MAWDPERVAQVAMTLEPVTAAEETALAATGWQRLRVDSHEVWARTAEAAQLEIESRRRHPSSRPRWGSGCERRGVLVAAGR